MLPLLTGHILIPIFTSYNYKLIFIIYEDRNIYLYVLIKSLT